MAPSDAAAAARSFPRRYQAALEPGDEDDEVAPEALEHARLATAAVAAAAEAVRPGRSFDRQDLAAAALALADAIERLPVEEWEGPRGEAARLGIHQAVHHLRNIL